jgi:hypothetical protein
MTPDQEKLFEVLHSLGIERYHEELPVYKYVPVETGKKILRTSTIKFSTASELNDKDLEMELLRANATEEQKLISTKEWISAKIAELPAEERAKLPNDADLDEWIRKFGLVKFNELLLQGYEKQRDKIGIFCTTTSPKIKKMWKNYADRNKGICIEFKFPSLFSNLYTALKVNYDKTFDALDLLDETGTQNEAAIYRWIFTKREHYRCEHEVRIVSEVLMGIHEIDKDFITGVYYGKRIDPKDKKEIKSILFHNDFPHVKTVQLFDRDLYI